MNVPCDTDKEQAGTQLSFSYSNSIPSLFFSDIDIFCRGGVGAASIKQDFQMSRAVVPHTAAACPGPESCRLALTLLIARSPSQQKHQEFNIYTSANLSKALKMFRSLSSNRELKKKKACASLLLTAVCCVVPSFQTKRCTRSQGRCEKWGGEGHGEGKSRVRSVPQSQCPCVTPPAASAHLLTWG